MWIYLLGPFLAVLPLRWRGRLAFHDAVRWRSAAMLSGLAESVAALAALIYWYSYSVTTWVSKALDNVLSKSTPTGITDHEVGFAALVIFATHPLTWSICCVGIEGVVRLCAPFSDTVLGIFPLYLADKIYCKIAGLKEPAPSGTPKFAQSHVSSYMGAVREKVTIGRLGPIPDELCTTHSAEEECLEIRSCRGKPDWDPPRVVRYQDRYFSLEESLRAQPPRPYVYKLRRLAAGVPSRTLLIYSPDEEPLTVNR